MKVLLIMPSMESSYWKKLGKKVGPRSEPLSLAYLGAVIKQQGHNVKILDCGAQQLSLSDVKKEITKEKYDIAGVTLLTMMFTQAKNISDLIKKHSPQTKIVLGGPHATIEQEKALKKMKSADFLIYGEAEETFKELIQKKDYTDIKGLIYKDKDKIIKNEPRPIIKNLDQIPMPDRSLLDMTLYRPSVSYYQKLPSYIIVTSRGCPYRCTYCSKVFDKLYRHHSPDRVIQEMKELIDKYQAKEIVFRDDTFTIKREFVKELCEKIIQENLHKKIKWSAMTRVDLIDYELLKLMKKSGCWGLHFGVESGVQRLLDLIKKDITLKQVEDAFKWTRQVGIETRAFFMLGLPSETREESIKTIKFAKKVDPDWAQFTITVPYPGTELFQQAKEYGNIPTEDWDNYLTWAGFGDSDLVWVTRGRTSDELKQLQKKAMKEFYFRPKIILRKMIDLKSWPLFKTYLTGALALRK